MTVSRILAIHKALQKLGELELKGNIAFRVAKNLYLTQSIYDIVESKKQNWLKKNAETNNKGEYNLQGDILKNFVNFLNSILEVEETLQEMKMLDVETDLPDNIKPSILMPLIDVCLKE